MIRRPDMRDVFVHIAFVVLSVLAVYWFAVRMYADAAYYLFHVINLETFHIEHGRFVLAISQLIPLLAVKSGLSLKLILILYSLGHIIFYYCLFLLSRYRYGSRWSGILLILLQVLGLEMGYFSPMFELYYGTAMLVLVAGILWSKKRRVSDYIILLGGLIIVLSSHPMAVLLTCFTVVMHVIEFKHRDMRLYVGFIVCLLLYGLWKWLSASEYESGVVSSVIRTYRDMPYGADYLIAAGKLLLRYYWELLILWALTSIWLVRHKQVLYAAFLIVSGIGMLVVIHGVHYGFQHSRYQEQVYFPLSYIIAFPFCLLLGRDAVFTGNRRLVMAGLSLLFVVRVVAIGYEAPNFERRIEMMERQIAYAQRQGLEKAVCGEANVTRRTSVDPNWSYGIETLLLSSRGGPEESVSIIFDTDLEFESNREKLDDDEFLMRRWDIKPLSWLNDQYFSLSTGPYTSLTNGPALDTITDAFADNFELRLPPTSSGKGNTWVSLDIEIVNRSSVTLPADTTHRIYLAYHWKLADSIVVWDGHRTPLEVNIESGVYYQGVDIFTPDGQGEYTLIVDIVAENKRWFGIDAEMDFVVK